MDKVILRASKDDRCKAGVCFGGCKINGIEYWYVKEKDAMLEKNVFSIYQSIKKKVTWDDFLEGIKKGEYEFPKKEITNFKTNLLNED